MIWFFQRAEEEMRVVTRFDRTSSEYVVEIEWPGREPIVERFGAYDAFNARVQQLHVELVESQWVRHRQPSFMSDGWRGPISRS